MFSTPFNTEAGTPPTMRAVWLSHHQPDHLDRCVVVGGRLVCRRCLALWPLTFVALCLSFQPHSYAALRSRTANP